jgi:hypothetical protein
MLDEKAVKRLMGDDPEFILKLKQCVLNSLVKRCAKQVLLPEVGSYIRDVKNYNNAILAEFSAHIKMCGYPQEVVMDNATKKLLRNEAAKVYSEELKKIIDEMRDKFYLDLKDGINTLTKQATEYAESELSNKFTNERLNLIIAAEVRKKLGGK